MDRNMGSKYNDRIPDATIQVDVIPHGVEEALRVSELACTAIILDEKSSTSASVGLGLASHRIVLWISPGGLVRKRLE